MELPSTLLTQTLKNKKKFTLKKFLIRKWNFLCRRLKNFMYFQKWNFLHSHFSYISGWTFWAGKIKRTHSEKIFLIFREMKLSSLKLKKLREKLQSLKSKQKICSGPEEISYLYAVVTVFIAVNHGQTKIQHRGITL